MMQYISRHTRSASQTGRRGFALASVLVGIIVLSLLAGSLLHLRTNASYSERDSHKRAELEMAVQAGINLAILGLTDTRADKRWRVDGVPITITFNNIPVTLTLQDESGKIDLNASSRDTFVRLFQSAGLEPHKAASMADRVLDWRESNNLAHLNGSTDEDYRASGSKVRPRHKALQSVDELKLVLGMTPNLFERLRPALTVYSQSQQINQQTAPREVLLTLPDMNAGVVERMINERLEKQEITGNQSIYVRTGVLSPLLPMGGRSFTIMASGQVGKQKIYHEQVIRITNDPKRPFLVLMWK